MRLSPTQTMMEKPSAVSGSLKSGVDGDKPSTTANIVCTSVASESGAGGSCLKGNIVLRASAMKWWSF